MNTTNKTALSGLPPLPEPPFTAVSMPAHGSLYTREDLDSHAERYGRVVLEAAKADRGSAWENSPAYLIDHCEGDTITEEGLQAALSRMLADPQYSSLSGDAPTSQPEKSFLQKWTDVINDDSPATPPVSEAAPAVDQVREALADLLQQVDAFCFVNGEADFETAKANAALATPAQAAPSDMVSRATPAMLRAGSEAVVLGEDRGGNPVHITESQARMCFEAMLAATPAATHKAEPVPSGYTDGTSTTGGLVVVQLCDGVSLPPGSPLFAAPPVQSAAPGDVARRLEFMLRTLIRDSEALIDLLHDEDGLPYSTEKQIAQLDAAIATSGRKEATGEARKPS